MLVYKALYRKMMDALKDAGMWLDWADQLKTDSPDTAKYLAESAAERLEKDFPTSYKLFCFPLQILINEDRFRGSYHRRRRY